MQDIIAGVWVTVASLVGGWTIGGWIGNKIVNRQERRYR